MTSGSGDIVMNISEASAVPQSFAPPGGVPAALPGMVTAEGNSMQLAGGNSMQGGPAAIQGKMTAGGNSMQGGPAAIQGMMTAGGNSMQLEAQQTILLRMSPSRNAATFSSLPTKPQLYEELQHLQVMLAETGEHTNKEYAAQYQRMVSEAEGALQQQRASFAQTATERVRLENEAIRTEIRNQGKQRFGTALRGTRGNLQELQQATNRVHQQTGTLQEAEGVVQLQGLEI